MQNMYHTQTIIKPELKSKSQSVCHFVRILNMWHLLTKTSQITNLVKLHSNFHEQKLSVNDLFIYWQQMYENWKPTKPQLRVIIVQRKALQHSANMYLYIGVQI